MPDMSLLMLGLLAVMIVFMVVSNRRRQKSQQDLLSKIEPGAEVLTSTGIFGTVRSVDRETNVVTVESVPGTLLRVHLQTIGRVIEDETAEAEEETATETAGAAPAIESIPDQPGEVGPQATKPQSPDSPDEKK